MNRIRKRTNNQLRDLGFHRAPYIHRFTYVTWNGGLGLIHCTGWPTRGVR